MSSLHSAGVTLPSQTPWLMGPTGTTGLAARSFAAPIRPGILSGGGAVSSLAHPEQLPGPGRTPPQADHLRQAKVQPASGDKEALRALLRHERHLRRLHRQNRALRSALCKADPLAPVCKAGALWDSSDDAAS
jgi:hypothetical protein